MIFCLAISVLLFGSFVWAETPGDSKISFSVPFACKTDKRDRALCLTNVFQPGMQTVLLGEQGTCEARTEETFVWAEDKGLRATRLSGTEKCFPIGDSRSVNYFVAIMGVEPSAVIVLEPDADNSPVPKEIELKARKLALPKIKGPRRLSDMTRVPIGVSDAPPNVFRTGNVTLLNFELTLGGKPWEMGPTVALTNAGVFLLEGACTGNPIFFSVNGRLHATYGGTVFCCGCGDSNSFVYALSNGTPKMVYQDSFFSD